MTAAGPAGRLAALIVGPPEHGVVILARQVAEDLRTGPVRRSEPGADRPGDPPRVIDAPTVEHLLATDPVRTLGPADLAHVHVTDQLFGPTCAAAARAYGRLVEWASAAGAGVSVTLHDLPDPADDAGRYRRRRTAYAEIVAATAGPVIVSSHHEAVLLRRVALDRHPVVIPLAVGRPPGPNSAAPDRARPAGDGDVAILGFVYPGKGHRTALDALRVLPGDVGLVALGRPADGHQDLIADLENRAAGRGRRFSVTGYLSDAELGRRLRRASIPLAAHDRISASGSIATWIGAGRRPLVPDGPYTRELDERSPGTVTRYPPTPAGLEQALARAAADPDSTWLADGVEPAPSRGDVARAYRAALDPPAPTDPAATEPRSIDPLSSALAPAPAGS